jgi:hypothetical protein
MDCDAKKHAEFLILYHLIFVMFRTGKSGLSSMATRRKSSSRTLPQQQIFLRQFIHEVFSFVVFLPPQYKLGVEYCHPYDPAICLLDNPAEPPLLLMPVWSGR